jgi:hypothetical protein
VEKRGAITLREHKALMPRDGLPRSLGKRCEAEISKTTPLKRSGAHNQPLGLGIDAKTKTCVAGAVVFALY